MFAPERHFQSQKVDAGVGVFFNRQVVHHRMQRVSGSDIKSDADSSLMQICPSAGSPGCQPHHGHGRKTLIDNDPHVGNSLKAVIMKNIAEMHQLLNDSNVILAAEAVQPAQDIGNILVQLFEIQRLAGSGREAVFMIVSDHQNPGARRCRAPV